MSILIAVWAGTMIGFTSFIMAAVEIVVVFTTYWTAGITVAVFAGVSKFPADLALSRFGKHFFGLNSFEANIHICRQGPSFNGQFKEM